MREGEIDMTPNELYRCHICGAKLVPDEKSKNSSTDEWDEHTFKFSCDCSDKNLRISIG